MTIATTYALSTMALDTETRINHFVLHVFAGLSFMLPGLWLAINVLRRHHRSTLSEDEAPFKSYLWYPGPFTKRIPLDGVVRFVANGYATLEQVHSCCMLASSAGPQYLQHVIFFLSMWMSATFDILSSLSDRRPGKTRLLPLGADRAASMLTAVIGFLVFHYHFHNESPLQSSLHGYYNWLYGGQVLAHVAEMLARNHVWAALLRPYVLFVSGQWAIQTAFILYFPVPWPRKWDDTSIASILAVNFLLCSHLVAAFVFFLTLDGVVKALESRGIRKQLLHFNNNCEEEGKLLKISEM